MKDINNRDIEVIESDPFRNDALDRLDSAHELVNFLEMADESIVLCIDAPWGQGKTTFLRMWQQLLKNNDFPTVYFNAWESDFSDDALVCLIGELESAISESGSTSEDLYKKLKNTGITLTKHAIPLAIKTLSHHLIQNEDARKILASLSESIAKEQIEKYTSSKKTLHDFKKQLTSFAKSLSRERDRPLIFIIDELDRCRPNFAIEVLEKAKHLFKADNVVFVLGVDRKQLGSSFKSIYGQDLDVANYLRRFIDFEYKLPVPQKGAFTNALFKRFSIDQNIQEKGILGNNAEACFAVLFDIFHLSLREQEHCCSLFSLAIKSSDPKEEILIDLLSFLIVIKVKFPDLYTNWLINRGESGKLTRSKELEIYSKNHNSHLLIELDVYFDCLVSYEVDCNMPEDQRDNLGLYIQSIELYSCPTNSPEEIEYQEEQRRLRLNAAERICKYLYKGNDIIGLLLKKIDLVSRFHINLTGNGD